MRQQTSVKFWLWSTTYNFTILNLKTLAKSFFKDLISFTFSTFSVICNLTYFGIVISTVHSYARCKLYIWAEEQRSRLITALSFIKVPFSQLTKTTKNIQHTTSPSHSWSFWIQCTDSVAWRLRKKQENCLFLSFDILVYSLL